MDYTYIKETKDSKPKDCIDFINQFERTCKAYDISLYDDNKNFKTIDELFKDITIANLKYYDNVTYGN